MAKRKVTSFVFGSDLHGDLQHKKSAQAFLKFTEAFDPDVRIFGGDLWDFSSLRAGAKDTEDEKGRSLLDDFFQGEQFINRFFDTKKKKVFLAGNHDYKRVEGLLKLQDARLREYGERLIVDMNAVIKRRGVEFRPYDKRLGVYELGNLRMVHGYACGVYATRKHIQTYGNVIHGHTHHQAEFHEPDWDGHSGFGAGCLCQLDHGYNSTHLAALRQSHGWAYGIILPNGKPIVRLAYETDKEGEFIVSGDFTILAG